MTDELNIAIIDMLELINFTLSLDFTNKWSYKYSPRFIKHFQLKLLEAFKLSKPLKIDSLYNYLTKKCGYSSVQVNNFFKSIDINLYKPIISGYFNYPE